MDRAGEKEEERKGGRMGGEKGRKRRRRKGVREAFCLWVTLIKLQRPSAISLNEKKQRCVYN